MNDRGPGYFLGFKIVNKMATKAKKTEQAPIFLKPSQMTGGHVAGTLGGGVMRLGTYTGVNAIANMPKVQGSKIRKALGPISFMIGTGAELFCNTENPWGKTIAGGAQGLSLWGATDTLISLTPGVAAKVGLSGTMGAVPRESGGGFDWDAIVEQSLQQDPMDAVEDTDMSGLDNDEDEDDLDLDAA